MVDTRTPAPLDPQRAALEQRFKAFLDLVGITRPEFAALEGLTQQHITTWLGRGRFGRAGVKHMRELALAHGVEGFSEDWINLGVGRPPRIARTGHEGMVAGEEAAEVAAYSSSPTKNGDYVTFEFLLGYSKERTRIVDIPICLLNNIKDALKPEVRAFINPTDALSGVIERGDLVLVDTSADKVDGDGIYVYKIDDIPQIRRFQIRGTGVLRLQGTHSYEESIELSGPQIQGLKIGGRVVGSIGQTQF